MRNLWRSLGDVGVHIAIVSQNADLAVDIRPRAEAEALAAAGHTVTLVGGTEHPARLRG